MLELTYMIGYLTGKIKDLDEKTLTLLTSSGVGYRVFTTLNTLLSKEKEEDLEIFVFTSVKDSAIDLYGFEKKEELQMFEKLITVSGIGPRTALNILSVSSVGNIALAVENGEPALLSGIPGLGKRSCEKIIIELKGKLANFVKGNLVDKDLEEENDAKLALVSLGYSEKDVNNTIKELKEKDSQIFNNMEAGEIIKEVLKGLR